MKKTSSVSMSAICGLLASAATAGAFDPPSVVQQPAKVAAISGDPGTKKIRDDKEWIALNATLLFEDSFDREETGNGALAIGNGWTSATADRVPHIKQADLDGGILKVTAAPEAGHGPHIHHNAGDGFQNGAAWVRFKLPGSNKGEILTVGYVDRECQEVLAGHICYAFISAKPGRITLMDKKTGYSNKELAKLRDPYLKAKQKLPQELEAIFAPKLKDFDWVGDHEWHELLLVTEGDEMRVSIDGKLLGSHRSTGFAHTTKRWFSLGIAGTAWVDEVKLWSFR
jgi:hypothetical protein